MSIAETLLYPKSMAHSFIILLQVVDVVDAGEAAEWGVDVAAVEEAVVAVEVDVVAACLAVAGACPAAVVLVAPTCDLPTFKSSSGKPVPMVLQASSCSWSQSGKGVVS